MSSWPSQGGIEFKRELEVGGHLPIEELCQPTLQHSAACPVTVNMITAKLQSSNNENFQGGKDRAVVMLEAVHVGQLAQISQRSASEGKVEADTGMGPLALQRRDEKGLRSLARIFILLSCPASAGIWDQKGLGKRVWRT